MSNIIEKLIYEKLTENTGKHFLDSGGYYGRHWQRNKKKTLDDFRNEEEQFFEVGFNKDNKANEIIRKVSVFHFLGGQGSNLELDDICNQFNAYNELDEDFADCEAYGVNISAWNYLLDYIDLNNIRTWNTYNYDSDLSQVLQGANIRLFVDGQYEDYVLIQIHGGCDVRGGYTNAMLFKCDEGIINEYLFESMDTYDLKYELEHIDKMHDWLDNKKVYEGKELEKIKSQLLDN
jgi:hypothetical protein